MNLSRWTLANDNGEGDVVINTQINKPGDIDISASETKKSILAFPNPVKDKLLVQLKFDNEFIVTVHVFDSKGAFIQTQHFSLFKGSNLLTVDMTGIATCNYELIIKSNKQKNIKLLRVIKR
jgi:hypothetical protein